MTSENVVKIRTGEEGFEALQDTQPLECFLGKKYIDPPFLALKNSSSTEGLFFYVYDYISSLLFFSGKLWKIPSVMCRKVSDQYNYC